MKILIACDVTPKGPFMRTLSDALEESGVDLTCSVQTFWTDWRSFDIIHFQWPDSVLRRGKTSKDLESTISCIRQSGIKIVTTVHNLAPHYCNDKERLDCYDIVYRNTDIFVHLGTYSCSEFKKQYPDAEHRVILHHAYTRIYTSFPSREDASAKLNLAPDYKYILCLGSFRAKEERQMISELARGLNHRGYRILAPSFYKFIPGRRYFFHNFVTKCIIVLRKVADPNLIIGPEFVPFEDVPYYYAVSDMAFVQRKVILNSGNVPMAFLFGKVVVGPNIGNVGPWLSEVGNPTFDPSDAKSILDAIDEAEKLVAEGVGERNREYALSHIAPATIASQYKELYESAFEA